MQWMDNNQQIIVIIIIKYSNENKDSCTFFVINRSLNTGTVTQKMDPLHFNIFDFKTTEDTHTTHLINSTLNGYINSVYTTHKPTISPSLSSQNTRIHTASVTRHTAVGGKGRSCEQPSGVKLWTAAVNNSCPVIRHTRG